MADLVKIGKIFVLIDGILMIINSVLFLLGKAIDIGFQTGTGQGTSLLGGTVNAIVAIIVGVIFVFIFLGKIKIKDALILGIVVLVLALMFGNWLSLVGGILILLDKFL